MWQLVEPVHAVTYFDPTAREPLQQLGIEGFWAGYVISRAAPLGPVGPALATASFFGFHPRRAASVLPDAWLRLSPADALEARGDGATAALEQHTQDTPVDELADLLWRAAAAADCEGRVLAAANQAIPRPPDPLAALWQATTTLREHRGDGHVAALISHRIAPIEAMQLKVAAGESRAEDLRLGRGWSEEEWASAGAHLERLGWVEDGRLTVDGQRARADVEVVTDAAARKPWSALSPEEAERTAELLEPIARSVWASGVVPTTNPVGVGAP
ncbi:MAG: hypothetical protein JWM22_1415 [Frankiales bacterium]|nr:hypothetical protein [Frankiales bacterium]